METGLLCTFVHIFSLPGSYVHSPPPGSEGKELVQPCCLPVRLAGQAAPPAVTEPEPFPLLVEPDTIQFPAEQPRVVKLKINNKTRLDYEVMLLKRGRWRTGDLLLRSR